MQRAQVVLGGGIIAVCITAACCQAVAGESVTADLSTQFAEGNLQKAGTSSLSAYSKQGKTTNSQFSTTLITSGVDQSATAPKPTETDLFIKVEQKDGTVEKYTPIVRLTKQDKSLLVQSGDAEEVVSVTGAYKGVGGQFIYPTLGVPTRYIGALALQNTMNGNPPKGSAAGGAYDPFSVPGGSSFVYGAMIDTSLQLNDATSFGGVELYALDSSVFTSDDVDNFEDDGSPFEDTLWALSLTADGPLVSTSSVQVDFELNPDALNEIQLPSSYLFGLPLYSPGLTNAEIASLVDGAIDGGISQALTLDSDTVSLTDFSLFPAGTQFQAAGSGVVYADGVNAVLSDVPEPATSWLIAPALIGLAGIRLRRRNRYRGRSF
jgi:hypothetical protein